MIFEKYEIERALPSLEEYEAMPEDQRTRLKEMDLKLAQFSGMLHTFKKKWFGTNLYPGSHNESKMKGTVTSTDTL